MKGWKLSRTGKIVLNFLVVLLLWTGIWLNNGAPYPMAKMELHRMERQNLLPPSEIVFWEEESRHAAQMVGVGEDFVVSAAFTRRGHSSSNGIAVLPRKEEPMLVWLRNAMEGETASGETAWGLTLVLIQAPEETVRAELDVKVKNKTAGEPFGMKLKETRREDGLFCFWFDPTTKDAYGEPLGTSWSRGNYVLRLYRKDGSLIGEHTGYLDEGLYSGRVYLR